MPTLPSVIKLDSSASQSSSGGGQRKTKQWLQILGGIVSGVIVVGCMSGSTWYMNYVTTTQSLESMAQEFMETLPLYLDSSLRHRMDPLRLHQMAGLKMLQAAQANVTDWSGISMIRHYTTSFLQTFFTDNKCCFGIFANMGLSKEEVAAEGGWAQWLENHKTDYGNPNAIFDYVLLDRDPVGEVTLTAYRNEFKNGSASNPTLAIPLDKQTLEEQLNAVQEKGFTNWPFADGYTPELNPLGGWWRTVHRYDLQPGEFRFTPLFVWKDTLPYCLKVMGVVPLYENVNLPTDEEFAELKAGTRSWGRRVGAWIIGFKLWFLSAHLESLHLKGGFVYLVDRESGILVATSDTKVPLLSSETDYATAQAIRMHDVDHPIIKPTWKMLAPGGDVSTIRSQIVERELDGVRRFVLSFDFDFYGLDFIGVYTVDRDIMLEELTQHATRNALVSMVINIVIATLFLLALFTWSSRKVAQLYKEHHEQIKMKEKRVLRAQGATTSLMFNMVVVRLDHFMEHGRLLSYEQVMRRGELHNLAHYGEVKEFVSMNEVIFFSHQWLAWSDPDPHCEQYPLMVKAALKYSETMHLRTDEVWVWIDRTCIPQLNDYMKVLAIESLHIYASVCQAFIIVAPRTFHKDTGAECDRHTYNSRGWCRLEQFARLAGGDLHGMFVCDETVDLEPVTDAQLDSALNVVSGQFSCCQRGHPGRVTCDKDRLVDTLLGLYTVVVCQQYDTANPLQSVMGREMAARQKAIFPEELFGGLVATAHQLFREGRLCGDGLNSASVSLMTQSEVISFSEEPRLSVRQPCLNSQTWLKAEESQQEAAVAGSASGLSAEVLAPPVFRDLC